MKIKLMSSIYVHELGSYAIGSIVEFDKKLCNDLINSGHAIPVEDDVIEKPKSATRKKVKKEGEE